MNGLHPYVGLRAEHIYPSVKAHKAGELADAEFRIAGVVVWIGDTHRKVGELSVGAAEAILLQDDGTHVEVYLGHLRIHPDDLATARERLARIDDDLVRRAEPPSPLVVKLAGMSKEELSALLVGTPAERESRHAQEDWRFLHGDPVGLAEFVRQKWSFVEPDRELAWGWPYDLLCDEVEAVVLRREVRDLVVCPPSGVGSSLLFSVFLPAWVWSHRQQERILCVSSTPALGARDAHRTLSVIELDPDHPRFTSGNGTSYSNLSGGYHARSTIHGSYSGHRLDGLIIDSPYEPKVRIGTESERMARVAAVDAEIDRTSAHLDPKHGWRIVVLPLPRLGDNDLVGELIRNGARHVVLPMEFDPDDPLRHPRDPRTKAGELLLTARESRQG